MVCESAATLKSAEQMKQIWSKFSTVESHCKAPFDCRCSHLEIASECENYSGHITL
jgi:hypothetical protein